MNKELYTMADSAYVAWALNKRYYSHSQLSFRYGNEEMTKNMNGPTYDPVTQKNPVLDAYAAAKRIPVSDKEHPLLFAAGFGELHFYIKNS